MNPETTQTENKFPPVVIVHDVLGSPTGDWIPAVKTRLESMGHQVFTPALPTEILASYTLWKSALTTVLGKIPKGAIMIGHGIGGNILLSLLSDTEYSPTMLILINTLGTFPGHAGYRKIANSFLVEQNNYENIKAQIGDLIIIQGDQDPFVEPTQGQLLYNALGGTLTRLPMGHGTAAEGMLDFNELINIVSIYDKHILDAEIQKAESEKALRDTMLVAANIPGLHTMQTDMAQISSENASVVGSGLLRQARIEEKTDFKNSIKNPLNIFFLLITVVAILGGVVAFGTGVLKFIPETATIFFKAPDISAQSPMIIDALEKNIDIQNQDLSTIAATLQSITLKNNSGEYSYIGIPITSMNKPATLSDYFKPTGIKPASGQIGIMGQVPFYGVSLEPTSSPFMIIPVDNYDTAYSAMTSWTMMPRDIGIWMMIDPDTVKNSFKTFQTRERVVANNQVVTLYFPEPDMIDEDVAVGDTFTVGAIPASASLVNTSITQNGSTNDTVGVEALSWTFLDEHHVLIVKNTGDIARIKKRFQDKQGRLNP